jgi:signal transduction histidine kinase/CheY-like chemotaxis protein
MEGIKADFENQLRDSTKLVCSFLGISSFVLFVVSFYVGDFRLWLVLFAGVIFLVAFIAWRMDDGEQIIGRWLAFIGVVMIVYFMGFWMGWIDAIYLVFLPVALAAAMISLTAAGVTTILESLFVIFLPVILPGFTWYGASQIIILVVLWGLLGIMLMIYLPTNRLIGWMAEYYQRANQFLEEARDRKAELEQTLKDLKEANLQLTRLNKLAFDLRQMAEDARMAKAQFVANVSHELRTPLNMITGFTEMILQSPNTYGKKIPGALLADLAVILRNAEHLKDLIDDVLDMSQIEADQMALTRENVDFNEIIEFSVTAVRPLYELKKLYLKKEISENLPLVYCDRTRIREVLLNLLSNAGRFTEEGGILLKVWEEGNQLFVSVSDTGSGIAEEDINKLFHPFQQVDGSIQRRYGGTGLGLAISKQFIELHDGKIWVESLIGEGTTFTFHIPISPPAAASSDISRWFNPYTFYEERAYIPDLPKEKVRPRFVVQETGNVLQRLLSRYMGDIETVPVHDLHDAFIELAQQPAQVLLVNNVSINKTLENLGDSHLLPSGVPAIICSIPGIQEASEFMDVSDILVKPISQKHLMMAMERLGIDQGTVLIVDDEPDALHLFDRMLASSGGNYRVLLARDGQEAVNVIREYIPDIILMDLIMPNMDGFQLLEWRHQNPEYHKIPVIVISARDPAGQAVVSSTLAVTLGGGLSIRQLLTSIEALSQILSSTKPSGDRAQPVSQLD